MSDQIPDGVWLHLDPEVYFAQDCLGSTDLMDLHRKRLGWWWKSRHNPRHRRRTSAEQTYGSALHAIVLEGLEAYESRYAVVPTFPDAIDGIEDMKAKLRQGGFKLAGTSGWNKPDWLKAMRENLPRVRVRSNLEADWRRDLGAGRTEISDDDDWMLRIMLDVIRDVRVDNKDVRTLFAGDGGYPPLAEVSVFETQPDGIRRRWRIDRMFPRFDLDLKSLGNWSGRPLDWETGDLIAKYAYDIQRADYYEGRLAAYRHIEAGRIFGPSSGEERSWLRRFPVEFQDWDWVWLFYQKPDLVAGRAPVVFPVWDDSWDTTTYPEPRPSARRGSGARKARKALELYKSAVAEFGFDKPWSRVEPLHYTDDRLSPSIKFPPYIDEDDAADPAAYAA